MKYSIYYESKTGNTKLLAEKAYEILKKDIVNFEEYKGNYIDYNEDIIIVGFWTDKGGATDNIKELLSKIENKKIILFGTAGFMSDKEYYEKIINNVKEDINESCEVIDYFMCQGKMGIGIRKRYEKSLETNPDDENIKVMIKNFDNALSHPDEEDLKAFEGLLTKYM
ncbi:flavodoxin family protein BilS [Anaerofustis stercorihominis]|uniref:Flavodoxin family protein n=2 Tax=Anaerofustis stercorihominis TaxID=214853 RepID=B1C8Z5_9FIRM|nr:flavodoxin family protein BilS [Anaerofustis stercorihominis]EDS72055.1 flavodoxin family protein [Anaerofustis stercorihominis DSM 17244]MCQ4795895.1 flavodoxin family protein [Anaerofustis stercorihominis]RGD74894.1 hypothetical protein DW687_00780 [Anaerofustis stercorihominis]